MAVGQLISEVPNSVKIGSGGSAIPNCTGFTLNTSGTAFNTVVDDLAYELNGGLLPGKAVEGTLTFLAGGTTGSDQFVGGFTEGATLADDLIVVLPGKGTGTPDSVTVTLSNVFVQSIAMGPAGGRGQASISFKAYSSDGSTAPYDLAWG